jgi:hypothetical protein
MNPQLVLIRHKRRVAAAAAIAALALPGAAVAAAPVVATSVTPRSVLFGDRVTARLDVLVDTTELASRPVSVSTPTGVWTEVGAPAASTARGGRWARTRIELTLVCAQVACAPEGGVATPAIPPAAVTLRRRDGGTVRVVARWPAVVVSSRLAPGSSAASSPPFRLQTSPPPLRTRVSANGLAWTLDAVAIVLVLAAAALVAAALRGRRAPRAVDPLERALALAREAEGRAAPDRRRALALLARVARDRETTETAWSEPEPTPERLAALVDRIERRENGS